MPDKQDLISILNDPHFCVFAALFSVAMSPKWRMAHPEVPSVRGTLEQLGHYVRSLDKSRADAIQRDFIVKLSQLLIDIVQADPRLCYSTEDYEWLIRQVYQRDVAVVTFSMLFAVSMMRRESLNAEQVAEITGQAASTWRNKAAAGEIIGAVKVGRDWLFPVLSLKAYGVKVPSPLVFIEESEEESKQTNEQ